MPKLLANASLIASVIAMCLAIAALIHTAGWHINAGAEAATGSLTAALVALAIATWGWVERKQEWDRADRAQAALVIADAAQVEHEPAMGAFIQCRGLKHLQARLTPAVLGRRMAGVRCYLQGLELLRSR